MIWNIVDKRRRTYRWVCVNAVIEDVCHDNSCTDSDRAPTDDPHSVVYEERKGVSLRDAILWAEADPGRVTLYLYDDGDGI